MAGQDPRDVGQRNQAAAGLLDLKQGAARTISAPKAACEKSIASKEQI